MKKSLRGTRKIDGQTFYLAERELTKTAAKAEATRFRKAGSSARILKMPARGNLKSLGQYTVWTRKR